MRGSLCRRGSLLLQNIHQSLPVLQRLFVQPSKLNETPSQAASSSHRAGATSNADTPTTLHGASNRVSPGSSAFPPDPQSREEGDKVVTFFCRELQMGEKPLRMWRQKLKQRVEQRWGVRFNAGEAETEATHASEVPWTPVRVHSASPLFPALASTRSSASSATTAAAPKPLQDVEQTAVTLWLRPRQQDVAVVRSAMRDLKFLVSPLLLLSPPPDLHATHPTPASASAAHASPSLRPTTHEASSRWYATQPIPAGMFLMSVPTEAVLFANPPAASDPLLTFFMQVEELVAQLLDAAVAETAAHHGYAAYLCDSVVPCRNLPFLRVAELRKLFEAEAATTEAARRRADVSMGNLTKATLHEKQQDAKVSSLNSAVTTKAAAAPPAADTDAATATALDSPALSLLSFFHEDMSGEPLSDYLRSRLSKAEYAWWVSLVLAHRAGSSSLLPMIDKLNHSPLPNCYYTMATETSFCGLDVLDNLFAGVPEELLYQPYVHLFAIRDIAAGEELTLCYASAAEAAYRRAGTRMPQRPTSLQRSPEVSLSEGSTPFSKDLADGQQDKGGHVHRSGKSAVNSLRAHETSAAEDMQSVMDVLFQHAQTPGEVAGVAAPLVATGVRGGAADTASTRAYLRELQRLQHPGPQEVETAEGKASWLLQWGFVPPCDAVYSARDLMEVAAVVAERRVDTRAVLFPPPPPPPSPLPVTS